MIAASVFASPLGSKSNLTGKSRIVPSGISARAAVWKMDMPSFVVASWIRWTRTARRIVETEMKWQMGPRKERHSLKRADDGMR